MGPELPNMVVVGGLWSDPSPFPLAGLSHLLLDFMMLSQVYLSKFDGILDFVSHIKNFVILLAGELLYGVQGIKPGK